MIDFDARIIVLRVSEAESFKMPVTGLTCAPSELQIWSETDGAEIRSIE